MSTCICASVYESTRGRKRKGVIRREGRMDELTRNSEIGVGLHLSGLVAGETLEHSGVIRQKAINLETTPSQHSVARGLHGAYGYCVLIPHDIRLGDT